jgi:cytochrome P450
MTADTASPSVFDAGLPTIEYDVTAAPAQVYPRLLAAQRLAPIALGPFGPEVLSYELVRAVLRDSRFQVPPGYILAVQGVTSGPLWDKVVNSLLGMEGAKHQRVRSVVSKAFTPPADRASGVEAGCRTERADEPPHRLRHIDQRLSVELPGIEPAT